MSHHEKGPGCEERLFSEFSFPDFETWKKVAVESLKGAPLEKKAYTRTYEGITLPPMFRAEDLEGLPHAASMPGFSPYLRHAERAGYLVKPWVIAQKIEEPLAAGFNEALRNDLARGQDGLVLGLDSATRAGLDADDPDAAFTGRGLSVSAVKDLESALAGMDFRSVYLVANAGAVSLPLISLLSALLTRTSQPVSNLTGVIGADPLGELAGSGRIPVAIETAYDCMKNTAAWAEKKAPSLKTVLVSGSVYHDAGASAVEEVAFALAAGVSYMKELTRRGLSAGQAAAAIAFQFSLGRNFFMEIAKLRAARVLWAQAVEAFGGSEEAQKMVIHGRTSWWTKTRRDPYVNMLRNTTEAFAGAMGGVDSMEVAPFDEAVRLANEFSRRVSRNLQIILQEESHFVRPIDPSGGAYAVESLSDQIGSQAWALFQEVEKMGGMAKALEEGFVKETAARTLAERDKNLNKRKDVFIGVNMHPNAGEKPLAETGEAPETIKAARVSALASLRAKADAASALDAFKTSPGVEEAAAAALAGATLGELVKALGNGTAEAPALVLRRGGEPFESLRDAMEKHLAAGNQAPKIFLANLGPIPQHKARAEFSAGFLAVGGFEMVRNKGFDTEEAAAEAFAGSGARIAVICSTDKTYPEAVPRLVPLLKKAVPDAIVILAGRPAKDMEAAYKEAGLDDALYLGADCYTMVKNLQAECGVSHE